ncbi:MAG: hypothetical protein ACRD0O_02990 [Acidimicrobiia bacterium]
MHRRVVPLLTLVLVGVALMVLWLSNTTAYEPDGRTRCGPALQEMGNLFGDVAGRCHQARQDRLRLGLRMATVMFVVGGIVGLGLDLDEKHRRRPA